MFILASGSGRPGSRGAWVVGASWGWEPLVVSGGGEVVVSVMVAVGGAIILSYDMVEQGLLQEACNR